MFPSLELIVFAAVDLGPRGMPGRGGGVLGGNACILGGRETGGLWGCGVGAADGSCDRSVSAVGVLRGSGGFGGDFGGGRGWVI